MQPWSIRAKEYLVCTRATHGLLKQIKTPDSRSVRIDIFVARQMIDEGELRAPVVGKTSEMRNDELYVRIFFRQQLDCRNLTDNVVEHRQRERARALANFARNRGIVTMDLDADKTIMLHCLFNHRFHAASVTLRIDERKSVEA